MQEVLLVSTQLWHIVTLSKLSLACSATFSGPSNACLAPKDGLETSLAPFNLRPSLLSKSVICFRGIVSPRNFYWRHSIWVIPNVNLRVSSTLDCTNAWAIPILLLTLRHAKFFPSIPDPRNEKHVRIHVHLLRVLTKRKPSQNCLVMSCRVNSPWNFLKAPQAQFIQREWLYAWI